MADKCSGCGIAPAGVTHVCPPVGNEWSGWHQHNAAAGVPDLYIDGKPYVGENIFPDLAIADLRAAIAALQKALGAAEVRVKELEAKLVAHSAEGAEMREQSTNATQGGVMEFKVQIRDKADNLLTEWLVGAKDEGRLDIAREVAWLRKPYGDDEGRTNAQAFAVGDS